MNKKKINAWQIISAILAAIASVFSSLKKSHDVAHNATSDAAHSATSDSAHGATSDQAHEHSSEQSSDDSE